MKYIYFICYMRTDGSNATYGNHTVECDFKVRDDSSFKMLVNSVKKYLGFDNVVLISLNLLHEEFIEYKDEGNETKVQK